MPSPPRQSHRCNASGFTLMEVLVALLIIGITLGVLLQGAGDSIKQTEALRNMTIAQWVAENRLAELRLQGGIKTSDAKSGQVEMMNLKWYWQVEQKGTPDPNVQQITVKVSLLDSKKDVVTQIQSFMYGRNPFAR